MKLPRYVYHATAVCNQESIEREGLRANFGEVYASGTQEGCLTFMGFRLLAHFHFSADKQPEFVQHDRIIVFKIDTKATDKNKWEVGTDHNPEFFGDATSWVYRGAIQREAIVAVTEFAPREELV